VVVVDASAVVDLLLGARGRASWVEARVREASVLHAPHLIDLEVVSALRAVEAARASDALEDFRDLRLVRHAATPFLPRIWELRANLSPYDASYVVLAEAIGVPLVTTDRRLGRAPGHRATIELCPV
jgi:predicted nucleic acid-binding protein